MDYIEKPEQRALIQHETERFINRQFRGAMLEGMAESDVQALLEKDL